MASSKLSENLMGREVARLFGEISAKRGPADAPLLPLEHWECEQVRWSGKPLDYLTAQYAKRMVALYDVKAHLSFDDYARGVLWEHDNVAGSALPFTPEQLAEMKRRFPPRKLEGLKCFSWRPPKRQDRAKEIRRAA